MSVIDNLVAELKNKISTTTSFSELPYSYFLSSNSDRFTSKAFGLTSGDMSIIQGESMGFLTVQQKFSCILSDTFINSDDDKPLQSKIIELQTVALDLIKELEKSIFIIPGMTILIIIGQSIKDPDIILDISTVYIELEFLVKYRLKK